MPAVRRQTAAGAACDRREIEGPSDLIERGRETSRLARSGQTHTSARRALALPTSLGPSAPVSYSSRFTPHHLQIARAYARAAASRSSTPIDSLTVCAIPMSPGPNAGHGTPARVNSAPS